MMRIAAIQMVSGNDRTLNLEQAKVLLATAAEGGAELALLPENFAMFSAKKLLDVAKEENEKQVVQQFLEFESQRLNMAIVGGTLPLLGSCNSGSGDERVRSACLFYDGLGRCIARYDKIHLFDVEVDDALGRYCESDTIEPGDNAVTVEWNGIIVGLSVCYDLRFPELYKALVNEGAELLLVPSAFTHATGEAHWHTLLRSRAIETQCAVIGANQGGQHSSSRRTYGNSVAYDAWGRQLALWENGPGVAFMDVDFEEQKRIRQKMPVLKHQRFQISTKLNTK